MHVQVHERSRPTGHDRSPDLLGACGQLAHCAEQAPLGEGGFGWADPLSLAPGCDVPAFPRAWRGDRSVGARVGRIRRGHRRRAQRCGRGRRGRSPARGAADGAAAGAPGAATCTSDVNELPTTRTISRRRRVLAQLGAGDCRRDGAGGLDRTRWVAHDRVGVVMAVGVGVRTHVETLGREALSDASRDAGCPTAVLHRHRHRRRGHRQRPTVTCGRARAGRDRGRWRLLRRWTQRSEESVQRRSGRTSGPSRRPAAPRTRWRP